jgi:hypothetical protein
MALKTTMLPKLCAAATTGPELVNAPMKFAKLGAVRKAL